MGCLLYLAPMIPLPKPRGFWDYALFALIMTVILLVLFRLEASDGGSWADVALAGVVAVLFVFATILARRGEKARWIAHQTWRADLLVSLGVIVLMFGAIYADAYLLHPNDLTSIRLRHDIVLAVTLPAAWLWSLRRRKKPRML